MRGCSRNTAAMPRRTSRSARDAPDVTPMAIVEMFMPRNLFGAFVGNNRNALGDVLPLILFAILVGAAAINLPADRARAAAIRALPGQRPDDRHRALRAEARAVCRAGDDLQRGRQDRLGHRDRARRVRGRLHRDDAAAPVRDHVGVAQAARAAESARDLQAHAPVLVDGVLDQLERGVAADRARGRARGPRRASRRSRASCCRSARP